MINFHENIVYTLIRIYFDSYLAIVRTELGWLVEKRMMTGGEPDDGWWGTG